MEGPRAVRPEEMPSLRHLTDIVFRAGMMDEYPQLFNDDNHENLRVCVDDGRCVSHVGMTQRGASLFGCPIRVACIGAVSTDPDYRGQGLASACLDDAVEKAYRDGVDLMLVSGDRSLYRRRGCLPVGGDTLFRLDAAALPPPTPGLTVEPMAGDELRLVVECYQGEPVRFLRPLDDYGYALQSGFVMNRPADFLVVRRDGDFRGYLIVQRPREGRRAQLAEFAGDRHALLAALPEAVRRGGWDELRWQVARHDRLFHALCREAGLAPEPATAPGTLKLIHFRQLMERLRPRWEELLGRREADRLRFEQDGEVYRLRFGDEELALDRDGATRLLVGAPDDEAERPPGERPGPLGEALQAILPLPALWYGLNYV